MAQLSFAGLVVVGAVTAVAGCGGPVKINQPGDGGTDAILQEDAAPQRDGGIVFHGLTVRVVYGRDPTSWTPAGGASVALDVSPTDRRELETGADGRVSFADLDWAPGPVAVTAYLTDHPLSSRVGITDGSTEVLLWLASTRNEDAETVTISGTATGRANSLDGIFISATHADWWLDTLAGSAAWSLSIRKDTPFTLVAFDEAYQLPPAGRDTILNQYAWVVMDHDGVSQDTTIDVDFGQPATTYTVQGSFPLPPHPEGRMYQSGTGWINVLTDWGEAYPGMPTSMTLNAAGTGFDYTMKWVEPAGIPPVRTAYYLWSHGNSWEWSWVQVDGYPTAGAQNVAFFETPTVTTPSAHHTPYPMHQPISWTMLDQGTDVRCILYRDSSQKTAATAWIVYGPGDATTMTIPQPPSSMDPSFLGTGALYAAISVVDLEDLILERRGGQSEWFLLATE